MSNTVTVRTVHVDRITSRRTTVGREVEQMTDDCPYRIEAELGELSLDIRGDDAEWVDEKFDEKLENLLEEAESMSNAIRDGSRIHQ